MSTCEHTKTSPVQIEFDIAVNVEPKKKKKMADGVALAEHEMMCASIVNPGFA